MKKFLSLIAFSLMAILLIGCSFNSNVDLTTLNSDEDVLGFSALTSFQVLSNLDNEVIIEDEDTTSPSGEVDENEDHLQILEIERYLALIRSFQDDGFKVTETESDNEDYEKLMRIELLDLDGSKLVYEFYYNETVLNSEKTLIEGEMTLDGEKYYLTGKKEVEIEDDEIEESLKLRAYLDDENYIILKYEIETSDKEVEKEFHYSIYKDNEFVEAFKIEFEEKKNGEVELEFVFKDGTTVRKYEFELEDGELEVKYTEKENDKEGLKCKAKIKVEKDKQTGKNMIHYKFNNKHNHSHQYKHNQNQKENKTD